MKVFEGTAKVDIQGENTLEIVESKRRMTVYRVKGLKPIVVIRDFRSKQRSNKLSDQVVLAQINGPAAVDIHQLQNDSILIDLKDSPGGRRKAGRHTLSIASEVSEFIPQGEAVFDHFDFRNDDTLVYLAVYRHTPTVRRNKQQDWSFMSV